MAAEPRLLAPTDARLAPSGDLALARRILTGFRAPDAAQERARAEMLAFVERHPEDAHRRTCLVGHLTASALVLDASGERGLLTHHRKLGRWLQLGGHCDGDANLPGVALREAIEESGIEALRIDPEPIDLDVHPIPARPARGDRPAEPAHLHLDTRFLVHAPPGARERVGAESLELRWVPLAELERLDADESVRRLFRLAAGRRT